MFGFFSCSDIGWCSAVGGTGTCGGIQLSCARDQPLGTCVQMSNGNWAIANCLVRLAFLFHVINTMKFLDDFFFKKKIKNALGQSISESESSSTSSLQTFSTLLVVSIVSIVIHF